MSDSGKYWSASWNFSVGCWPCSPACENCWARRMVSMWAASNQALGLTLQDVRWTGQVVALLDRLQLPAEWQEGKVVAVNWLGDLFYSRTLRDIPGKALDVMLSEQTHEYLMLTKRPELMVEFISRNEDRILTHGAHLWWGVTAWDQVSFDQAVRYLARVPVKTWISLEPMLGPVTASCEQLQAIDWMVMGSETGPGARTCATEWIGHLAMNCEVNGVPVWVKQGPGECVREAPGPIESRLQTCNH